jgi:uncharacterized protein (TIGR00106 family)
MAGWETYASREATMIVAFSVTPLGVGDSVGDLVADCVRIVRESGLPNETNAMFTNVEGSWDEVMSVVKACIDHVSRHASRASVVVKIDHRVDDEGGRLEAKRARIEDALR